MGISFIQQTFAGGIMMAALASQIPAPQSEPPQNPLTIETVRTFVEDSSAMTSGQNGARVEEALAYLEKHIEDEARFNIDITFHIPDAPIQRKNMAFDKAGYIDTIRQGLENLGRYDSRLKMDQVSISKDGRKALVKTTVTERAEVVIPGQNGGNKVPLNGVSQCDQVLSLEEDVIRVYATKCKTSFQMEGDT